MSLNLKELPENIDCKGISVRTTNQAESNPQTAKIGALWQVFYQHYFAKLPQDSDIYGIYCNYDGDANGAFDVIAGFKQSDVSTIKSDVSTLNSYDLVEVTIPAGKYLVFSEQGALPDAVITVWQNIWAYFNDENCSYTRLYNVDFEHYVNESQVDVYIGIE